MSCPERGACKPPWGTKKTWRNNACGPGEGGRQDKKVERTSFLVRFCLTSTNASYEPYQGGTLYQASYTGSLKSAVFVFLIEKDLKIVSIQNRLRDGRTFAIFICQATKTI
jgi:hypothetical protein